MKRSPTPRQLSFQCPLVRISKTTQYYAFEVPLAISDAIGIRGPVPVSVRLNDAVTFLVSLAPIGGGRHWLRVNVKAREAAQIKEGDLVRVEITVLTHATEFPIPPDLASALRAAGVMDDFKSMTIGLRKMLIGGITAAAQPATREKRVQAAVKQARERKEKRLKK